jgi:hypothetical protein
MACDKCQNEALTPFAVSLQAEKPSALGSEHRVVPVEAYLCERCGSIRFKMPDSEVRRGFLAWLKRGH